jgi:hypothetical protein
MIKVKAWGSLKKAIATELWYVDLDNDGDLDLVTITINAKASVLRKHSEVVTKTNFLRVRPDGKPCSRSKHFLTANKRPAVYRT